MERTNIIESITKEVIRQIIENQQSGDLKFNKEDGNEVIFLTTCGEYAVYIWELLQLSYKDIGGIRSYKNLKDFQKKNHSAKIVLSNCNVIACATYRRIEGSYKMTAIGCNQQPEGKTALQEIIKSDIRDSGLHFWCEVSGAIEHYFKKYNGYAMPNVIAHEILNMPQNELILSKKDEVHYERAIGIEKELYEKMIFGIKSEELYQKAIESVENYSQFLNDVNKLNENINMYSVRQAIYIIENIYRAHEEDGYNELIPSWYRALTLSLKTLTNCQQKDETVNDYISYAQYLLDDMQVLKIHKITE